MLRLNHEEGGELVTNLTRLYEWWLNEVFAASQKNQPDRLEKISIQMGEVRAAWEGFQPQPQMGGTAMLSTEGLVG
jgi:flagellin-specific chaperone FliS